MHLNTITERFVKWKQRSSQIQEHQKQDLLEKWQILGLSFMVMSKTPEDFHDLVKQEFGFIWDGKGWMKEVVISDR